MRAALHQARYKIWLACALGSLTACSSPAGPQSGTDVGNGASIQLRLEAHQETAAAADARITLPDGTTINSLQMVVDRIRLVPGGSCAGGGDAEIDLQGPIIADLLNGSIVAGLAQFDAQGDTFCELRVGFQRLDPKDAIAGVPTNLHDLSIRVSGNRADGQPFIISSRISDRFELKAKDGAFSLPLQAETLFLGYDVTSWIVAADLDALPAAAIEIDETTNSTRLKAFEDALRASVRLFRDRDGDGALSLEEHASGNELAR